MTKRKITLSQNAAQFDAKLMTETTGTALSLVVQDGFITSAELIEKPKEENLALVLSNPVYDKKFFQQIDKYEPKGEKDAEAKEHIMSHAPEGWLVAEGGKELEITEEGTVSEEQPPVKEVPLTTVRLPKGTKSTALYVITPEFHGKPRWFEKRLLTDWGVDGEEHWVQLPTSQVKARGIPVAA